MAVFDNTNVALRGIAAAVPANTVEVRDIYRKEWGDVEEFISSTHVERLHVTLKGQTASDLCSAAAAQLISALGWEKEEIDAIVFVTQTPDYYFVPATACHIQERLGLPKSCLAFDVTLGCSGWVYGLGIVSSLLQAGSIKKALVLAGDTCSKSANPDDQGSAPLFGDAGTATALEYAPGGNGIKSVLFSDGSGYDAIITREGGYRAPVTAESFPGRVDENGILHRPFTGDMDGLSVFTFAISQAPKSIKYLFENFDIDKDSIDILALHQANLMINQKIIKKVKTTNARYPESLRDFGNTSCASIPLSLVTEEGDALRMGKERVVACGFGVGLSWGAVYFEADHVCVPKLIEI